MSDALDRAGYRVQRTCGACEHYIYSSTSPGKGRCHRLPYDSHELDYVSVLACGVCPSHAFAPGVVEGYQLGGYARFLPIDVRPVDQLAEDRALIARLLAIDDGLSEWEVGFVESIARWVQLRTLTEPQRARALEIDER